MSLLRIDRVGMSYKLVVRQSEYPRCVLIGRLRFHYDNEYENDIEISLSFSLRFCRQRDERLVASISLSTRTITNRNTGRTQEMVMSAYTNFVLVLVGVVVVKS